MPGMGKRRLPVFTVACPQTDIFGYSGGTAKEFIKKCHFFSKFRVFPD
jgi:hypothetical protein